MRVLEEKHIAMEVVAAKAATLRSQSKRIITTNGCFDLLHVGHLNYLREARAMGDLLWVALNSDASIRVLKGPTRPLQNQMTRSLHLAALEAVDLVTIFFETTPEVFLEKVKPWIHVKGGDYQGRDLPEKAVVEQGGGSIRCVDFTEGYSTTSLIERIKLL
jgi:D-glycero-beta-D-manno-heptose 1-phosphate adenylyltransferase